MNKNLVKRVNEMVESIVVNVLESFLHDVWEGESDISEITNTLGYNDFKELLKLAKAGEKHE